MQTMKKDSRCNSLLAAGGLVALCLYVLACRPAFSPDGTQVLFPSVDPETANCAVSRFNLVTRQTDVLFTFSPAKGHPVMSPQWTADGQRAVIAMAGMDDDSSLQVLVLPLGGKGPTRLFEVSGQDDAALSLVIPPPLIGSQLYLGGKGFRRLNLETGELKVAEADGELYLHRHGDQLYYWGELKDGENVFELGRMDRETLAREPIIQLNKADAGDVSAFISIAPDGSRIALSSEKEQQASLLIVTGSSVEQTILVGSSEAPVKLGNTQWSPDGKTIYATALCPSTVPERNELGVIEVPLDGTAARFTSLVQLKEADEQVLLNFQIALSPDGKSIAAGSCYLDQKGKGEVEDHDRALFILELTGSQRQVTKIQIPVPATSDTQ
jgi:Tol biopolymer transport system component